MWSKRVGRLTVVAVALVGLVLAAGAGLAYAGSDVKVAGLVDVLPVGPGGTLTLPLAPGAAPVFLQIGVGTPSVPVTVQITPATVIKAESGLPVTITDGDRVKAEVVAVGGVLRTLKLEVENFPEAEFIGMVTGLTGGPVTLPLPAGQSRSFLVSLSLSGADIPVTVTSATKVEQGPVTLSNGQTVQVETVLQNGQLLVTEIAVGVAEPEPEPEPEPRG
jgi:uncharacterized protein DUF5666